MRGALRRWPFVLVVAMLVSVTACSSSTAPSCVYTAAPSSLSLPAGGGAATIVVTTGAGCTWTAASSAGWLTITSGSSGTGNGATSVAAGANGQTPRSATLTVAGRTIAVSQDGAPVPTFVLSGAVTDAFLGSPFGVAGVSVTVSGGPGDGAAVTDLSGKYSIAGLLAGTYTVAFSRASYRTATATVTVSGSTDLPMILSLDAPATPSTADLTGYWSGTGSYPNNPFKLVLLQDGDTLRGTYVDQHDSGSVSGTWAATEFTLAVNFGDAVLLLECEIEDAREVNGVQRTSALGNRPYGFTMKR